MKIQSYDQKRCPCCGAAPLLWDRRHDGTISAAYECGCQWDNPDFGALWAYHEDVRLLFESLRASVPEGYRRYLTEPVTAHAGNLAAIKGLKDFGHGRVMYVHGPAGIGKSHLALQTAMRQVDQRRSVRFISELDLMSEYRARALTGEGIPLPQILVLDDVAKEGKPGEFYSKSVYRVLEACVAGGRGLIVTSNHSPEKVAELIALDANNAQAIVSRLRAGQVFSLSGRDLRQGSR